MKKIYNRSTSPASGGHGALPLIVNLERFLMRQSKVHYPRWREPDVQLEEIIEGVGQKTPPMPRFATAAWVRELRPICSIAIWTMKSATQGTTKVVIQPAT